MKISTRGRYALRLMTDVAAHDSHGFVSLKDVAERQEISLKYLEQILPALSKKGAMRGLSTTVSKLGLTLRGSYGESGETSGDIYQLSNQVTLGISEKAAIQNLKSIALQIAAQERAAREELFKTQLRAILRASAYGRLSLMLPMIVSVDEVRQSKRLLSESMDELRRENKAFDTEIELGIMVETPAAAIMCEELADEVDFFSVGTNDLTQYTLAADRQNPALCRLCDENQEPVLRLIEHAAEAIHRTGGWIGICGELAADLHLTQRFADMRIDELSVSPPYLLGVRGKVTECL